MRKISPLVIGLILALFCAPSNYAFAAPDDGYPQGVEAPGRTCPDSPLGEKTVSAHSGKTLVCTSMDGTKKWWIENEPLPPPPPKSAPQSSENSLPVFTHTYSLPKKSLAKMKVFRDVTYGSESSSQKLDIYLPKSTKKPPLLIWLHGGGFMFLDKSVVRFDEGAKLLEKLISNRVAVASLDYRLASEAKFPAAAQDVKRAIKFLRLNATKYGYDGDKFGVLGESSGAYLANMVGVTGDQKSIFDSKDETISNVSANVLFVTAISGNVDFRFMRSNIEKYPCKENVGKKFPEMDNPWFGSEKLPGVTESIASANLYPYIEANKNLPQFFIIHGTEDCAVSPRESIQLHEYIQNLGGKSALTLVTNGTHGGPSVWAAAIRIAPILKNAFGSK